MASKLNKLDNQLAGALTINGVDAWREFRVFLSEQRPQESSNYDALMALPAMRPVKSVSYSDEDGERLPEELPRHLEPREIELSFTLLAEDKEDFLARYKAFISLLRQGWLTLGVPELGRQYRVYYLSGGGYKQLTPLEGETFISSRFSVRFREPNPTI